MTEWIDEVATRLFKEYRVGKRGKSITLDGVIYNAKALQVSGIVTEKLLAGSAHEFASGYSSLVEEMRRRVSTKNEIVTDIPETDFRHTDFLPVVDVETNERLMLNNATKKLSSFSYDTWFSLINADSKAAYKDVTRLAKFEYDPYDLQTLNLIEYEHLTVLRVNLYSPPAWRFKEDPKAGLPKVIKGFLEHLFPNREEKTFVLDWLYPALVERS